MTIQQAQDYFDERITYYSDRLRDETRLRLEKEFAELQDWLSTHVETHPQYTSVRTEYLEAEKRLHS